MAHNIYFQSSNNEILSWTTEASGTSLDEVLIELTDAEYDKLIANYKMRFTGTLPAIEFTKPVSADIQDDKAALQVKVDADTVTAKDVAQLLIKILP